MVQPPPPVLPARRAGLRCQFVHAFGRRAYQVVLHKEAGEILHQCLVCRQWRGGCNVAGDLLRFTGPAQQAFKLEPADAKKTVGHRVLNGPGGRAVFASGSLVQAQVLTQWRQGCSAVHHQPVHSRNVASGLRNR